MGRFEMHAVSFAQRAGDSPDANDSEISTGLAAIAYALLELGEHLKDVRRAIDDAAKIAGATKAK